MTILTAWSAVLSRLSGQDDIIIGTPTANRNHQQIESLIGFFVNTLAVRIDLSGNPTVCQLLERVRNTTLAAQAHQDLPFEQVVDIVQPPRSLSHSPLFQVMFVWQNNEVPEWSLPAIEAVEVDSVYEISKFDFTLQLYETNNEIVGALEYSTALFDRSTVERYIGYLLVMLQAMAIDIDRVLSSVDLLAPAEHELLVRTWNETQQDYPAQMCIHNLFEHQVERTPQATALVFMDQSMTYAELNVRSNRLAHHLIELGVQPDMRVAICVERSFAMIIGVLAILKAGGAYLPLDPSYPKERLVSILDDAEPIIMLADTVGRATLGEASLKCLNRKGNYQAEEGTPIKFFATDTNCFPFPFSPLIDDEEHHPIIMLDPNEQMSSISTNPRVPTLTSRHLAYVIYTSGSTGRPKGVMIEHQGPVNVAGSRSADFGIDTSSRVIQFSSICFDVSILEVFCTLCSGARLYLLQNMIRLDPILLWEYLGQHSITHTFLTPGILLDCKNLTPLSNPITMTFAGEALPASLVRSLYPLLPNGRIVNDYGPTEIVVSATAWNCPRDLSGDIVPIGRALANKRVYILDQSGRPAPLGTMGEIHIGGVGVARGYLNRPELTAQVFIPDTFSDDPNGRMYKSGDLGRFLSDGKVVYRGFRIELGEIEARLVDHTMVEEAAVIAMGEGSDKRLVAYVIAKPDDHLVRTLRSHLSLCVPDYMVPSAIVRMDEIPRDNNGKLDRRQLPIPDGNALVHQLYEAPRGEIETALMTIWMELLNVDRVGRHDNFFMLGGHSLMA
ncbi:hypothetical protein BGZ65_008852, partial [Modicella reniformis]